MLKNKIEYFLFISVVKIVNLFGIKKARIFAKVLAFIFYSILKLRRKVVIDNLKKAFPNKTHQEILTIAKANYFHISLTFIEMMCVPYISKEKIIEMVSSETDHKIKQLHGLGKGLILLTAHMGNWELIPAAFASKLGIEIHLLSKPQRNGYITDWIKNMRKVHGNKIVMLGQSVRDIFKVLMDGGIIGVVGDQRGSIESNRVKYFGIDTAVYSGTASIALKLHSPILLAMIIRKPDYTYKVDFIELNYDHLEGKDEEKIIRINQKYMNILEEYVREHPEQWFWMHNIWKY